jgi:hypothetical protein
MWGDTANYFCERDMKYESAKFTVPAVVKPQFNMTAATLSLTTVGEIMQTLDIVCRESQLLAVTYCPGSSQMRLGFQKPQ